MCSSASTSSKNPLLVWDCDQRARANSLIKRLYAGFFSRSINIRSLLLEYVFADLREHVFIVVSTKCKVIFAAASFRNSSAQFF